MKKIVFLFLCFLVAFTVNNLLSEVEAGNTYDTFSQIEISSGRMIKYYSNEELAEYNQKVSKRKWMGWNIEYINTSVKCNFVSETVFSIYNSGTTPIKYELTKVTTKMKKTSITVQGKIGFTIKGEIKKFKGGLDAELKIDYAMAEQVDVKMTEKFEIVVDPNTQLSVYLEGNGFLTNGVCKKYEYWITVEKGTFEYFTVADLYLNIRKEKI
ncbi:MAG: hypothetical protein ACRC5M_02255 [Anaeroplasmataceae bacterium]